VEAWRKVELLSQKTKTGGETGAEYETFRRLTLKKSTEYETQKSLKGFLLNFYLCGDRGRQDWI
jgi:hypothetical protein|tara:strand:- start:293 stop:484 length:192 start_codon:yes stop_codon:yes gene_type:complete